MLDWLIAYWRPLLAAVIFLAVLCFILYCAFVVGGRE